MWLIRSNIVYVFVQNLVESAECTTKYLVDKKYPVPNTIFKFLFQGSNDVTAVMDPVTILLCYSVLMKFSGI